MARTVNEGEYNAKRGEILDVALRLVYSKGYQEMSIQDILDGLGISRGPFTTTSTPSRPCSKPWSTAWAGRPNRLCCPWCRTPS